MALCGWGATLGPDEALARALSESGRAVNSRAHAEYTLSHTFQYQNSAVGYVFTTGARGFLIVSADEIATPMLGYSDSQEFDAADIPDGLQYWLESYAREIEWAKEHDTSAQVTKLSRADDRAVISPMIATKWSQSAPYNDMCPTIDGKATVTGCVATAMAQVLNYYKYPTKGQGSISYTIGAVTNSDGTVSGTDYSFDFANTTFDWNNMLDAYTGSATDAQKQAVATLMSACGASVQMEYSSDESGAFSDYVPQALIKYFGYSNSAYYTSRDYFTFDDWDDLVYDQLKTYGPLLYNGVSATGGHAFVLDGYNGDGYYHINWGWEGLSDGYFRLTALDPELQGIGGTTSGYNYMQGLVCNLRPSSGGSYTYSVGLYDNFEIFTSSARLGANFTWGSVIVNYSSATFAGYLNMAFERVNDGLVVYGTPVQLSGLPPINADGSIAYIQTITMALPSLVQGEYKVYPVFSTDMKTWSPILCLIYGNTYYIANVSSSTVTFTKESKEMPDLSDVDISPLYINQSFHMSATATNNGTSEYYGRVEAYVVSTDGATEYFVSDPVMLDILPGESVDFEITDEFSMSVSYTGAAKLVLYDMLSGNQIGNAYDVTINKLKGTTTISIGNIEYGDGYSSEQEANDLCFRANVTCTSGYFGGNLYMYIFPYEPNTSVTSVGYMASDYISVEAGESQEAVFKGSLALGTDGKQYFVSIYYDDDWRGGTLQFTLKNPSSAVTDVIEDAGEQILYDLSGRRVPAESARKGIYISQPASGGRGQKVIVR